MPENTAQPPESPAMPARNPGGCRAIALPLAILATMVSLIAIGFVVYLALHPSAFVASQLIENVGKTSLPDQQKQRIIAMVGDVEQRYAAGDLTREQADAIGREIFTDPSINAALFYHVAKLVIERDKLAAPGTAPGTSAADDLRVLQRLVRGIAEGTIDGKIINDLAPLISDAGRPKRSGKVEPEDYTAMMAKARAAVEQSSAPAVPDEPYEVDAAMMFERAIERGAGQPRTPS